MSIKNLALAVSILGIHANAIAQVPRPVQVLLEEQASLAPFTSPVNSVNAPFLAGPNTVAFSGNIGSTPSEYYIWSNGATLVRGTDFAGASGGESGIGATTAGQFIYSPSVPATVGTGTVDSLVVNGLLIGGPINAPTVMVRGREPEPAGTGFFVNAASRPTMALDGTIAWVGTFASTSGGSTIGRVMWRKKPGGPYEVLARSFQPFTGFDQNNNPISITLGDIGVDFGYDMSNNGSKMINLFSTIATNTASAFVNDYLFLNDRLILREGDLAPAGFGSFGSTTSAAGSFTVPVVNDSNQFAAFVRTTLAGFTVFTNAGPELKNNDVLNGITINVGSSGRILAINNKSWVAHGWGTSTSNVSLFLGSVGTLRGSRTVLEATKRIDTNFDGVADATVNAIEGGPTIGPALAVGENGDVFVRIQYTPDGGGQRGAMVRIPYRAGDVDFSLEVDAADIDAIINKFGLTPGDSGWDPLADCDLSGEIDAGDIDIAIANFGS